MELTEVLDFERSWWQHRGNKEAEIVRRFEVSVVRYYQRLNQIIDLPEAMAIDPMTVKRLRRMRARRAQARQRTTVISTRTQ
jgi:hypothetical protein